MRFLRDTFRSLRIYNYRLWAAGALVSNVGTWMQRIAQNWLVLAELTHNNATAVGIVMALQFGPSFLLLPFTGAAADRFDRRKLLIATQSTQGLLALGLGLLSVCGVVQLWHVYGFAFLFGCAAAFDAPARQTFVAELVGEKDLSNAVALNSSSFNAARMIGPAAAGLLVAAVGTGWAFLVNAVSFLAVLCSLSFLRLHELKRIPRPARGDGLVSGFRYIAGRRDLVLLLVMVFLIGTFGLNFQLFVSTMTVSTFHGSAGMFGLLSSVMAVGTLSGALWAASRARPRGRLVVLAALWFGIACSVAAMMPEQWSFAVALAGLGLAAQTFTTTTNSLMQLSADPAMRGRVMAIYMAIFMGGTPLGGPVVGWVADHFGPRWSLGVGACAGFAAALTGLRYLAARRALENKD